VRRWFANLARCVPAVAGHCVVPFVLSAVLSAQQPVPPPAPPPVPQSPPADHPPVPAAQAAPKTRPPFPNRLNELMPPWLRVRGEFRERAEGFVNAGFVDGRDDLYYLSRFRFNDTATGKAMAATVQLQDARVGNKTVGPTGTPFTASFDLRQAFVDVNAKGVGKTHIGGRFGRQEIAFGDQRLVGHANWINSGRTFDAARVTVTSKPAQIDLFAASVVRILDGEFDKSGNGNRFAGAYVSSGRILPRGTAESYLFWRRDVNLRAETGPLDSLQQVTAGARLVGTLPARLDYNVEMAVQRGSLGPDSVRAWAGHWQIRETLEGSRTPHLTAEYNLASGDADPVDGIRGTFDQLYPTAHDKYGLADQVGWRNIHHVRIGFDITPIKATPISVNYHSYWLAEKRDALYAASGAPLARVPGGAASRRVGQEIDVQIAHPLTPYLGLTAGYSHLVAGPFLKQATPGESYSGPFVMATYVFLADK
jgi:Alginate export